MWRPFDESRRCREEPCSLSTPTHTTSIAVLLIVVNASAFAVLWNWILIVLLYRQGLGIVRRSIYYCWLKSIIFFYVSALNKFALFITWSVFSFSAFLTNTTPLCMRMQILLKLAKVALNEQTLQHLDPRMSWEPQEFRIFAKVSGFKPAESSMCVIGLVKIPNTNQIVLDE